MKNLLFFVIFLNTIIGSAQPKIVGSFSELETLEIELLEGDLEKSIKFVPSNTTIFNDKLDLPYEYLEQGKYVVSNYSVRLIETVLNKGSGKKYFITWGPIDGPAVGFTIFESALPHKIIGQIYSSQIVVPGNGFIYSVERENYNFFVKKKYRLEEDSIKEVKQAYYGVNIDSYTLKSITIYQDEKLTNPIATIPEKGAIRILVTRELDSYPGLYLVQSSFGLVGWAKLEAGQYKSTAVEGLYYYGD